MVRPPLPRSTHRAETRAPRLLALGCVISSLLAGGTVRAGDPDAAKLAFERGVSRMEKGDYEQGCPDLSESYRLDPRPGSLFTLAECEARRGRVVTAVELYTEYLELHASLPLDKRLKQGDRGKTALAQKSALGATIPRLTLTLSPNAPPDTVVTRNGAVVARSLLGVGVPVDPGEQVLTTQVPGGPLTRQQITLAKGEVRQLTLIVKTARDAGATPTPLDTPPPRTEEGASKQRIAAYAVGALGLAGVMAGAVTGGLTLGKKATIKAHCGSAIHAAPENACDQAGLDAAASAGPLGLMSTVGFAVGLSGLATAAVLLLTDSRKAPTTGQRHPKPLLELGPGGAMIGVGGAF